VRLLPLAKSSLPTRIIFVWSPARVARHAKVLGHARSGSYSIDDANQLTDPFIDDAKDALTLRTREELVGFHRSPLALRH
jgi:hypothetical protein